MLQREAAGGMLQASDYVLHTAFPPVRTGRCVEGKPSGAVHLPDPNPQSGHERGYSPSEPWKTSYSQQTH